MAKRKINLYDAQHPARQKAIHILEHIAEYMGNPDMFDCQEREWNDTTWYDLEDALTFMIAGKKAQKDYGIVL